MIAILIVGLCLTLALMGVLAVFVIRLRKESSTVQTAPIPVTPPTALQSSVLSQPDPEPMNPFADDSSHSARIGLDVPTDAHIEKLLAPAEVYSSEPEKLVKEPLEERLDFPLNQIPIIPQLSDSAIRTPSQDSRRKEPSDDEFRMRELFPTETLLRESPKEDVPLDELGLPSIDSALIKEPLVRELSDREGDSEKPSERWASGREERSSRHESFVGPGALQDQYSQSKQTVPPVAPVVTPPPAKMSRRGVLLLALSGMGGLSIVSVSLIAKIINLAAGGRGFPPPVKKVKVVVCSISHKLPNPNCPKETIHEEEFIAGQEPKAGNPDDICKVHTAAVPATVRVIVCTVSHKLPNAYCPKSVLKLEEFVKGQEPTQKCDVHLPPVQKVRVRICTVSGKVANKYCPADTVKVEEFTKGQEPKEVCAVHHKPAPPPTVRVRVCTETGLLATRYCPTTEWRTFPAGHQPTAHCPKHRKPEVKYVYMMKCPVDGALFRDGAKFCPDHLRPLIRVRVPKN